MRTHKPTSALICCSSDLTFIPKQKAEPGKPLSECSSHKKKEYLCKDFLEVENKLTQPPHFKHAKVVQGKKRKSINKQI